MTALFELSDVSRAVDDKQILSNIDLTLEDHGLTAIVGSSGSGKTSLLRLLNRLDVPDTGVVRLRAQDIATIDPPALRRRVAMVFQRPPVFPGTVLDNLRVSSPDLDEDRAEVALEQVALDPHLIPRDATTLSGGESQRMCIARALLTDPEVLLADEPTSSLDERAERSLEELAHKLIESSVPIIWVTHDQSQVRRIADRVAVVSRGSVLAEGPLDSLLSAEDDRIRDIVGA